MTEQPSTATDTMTEEETADVDGAVLLPELGAVRP